MTHRLSTKPPIINWGEASKPFGEKLFKAVEYLKFRARNFNALAAYDQLEKFVAEQQKYLLFRQIFPDEWQRSQTSLFKTGIYAHYTERTNEFFELVHEHLFPLLSGWNEDPETDFDNFNIFSLNVDFCCEDIAYENLRVSYVAALLFFSGDEEIWKFLENNYRINQADFPEINRYSFENIWNLEKTGRIGLYLNIFEVVDHSTGNPWLDTSNCQYYESYSWDEKTVEFLTESYKEALEILEKTVLLDALVEANTGEILSEMISLWNTGKIHEARKKRRIKSEKKKVKFDESDKSFDIAA
jgi:hypothetical protein